jgi:hypothetical protein
MMVPIKTSVSPMGRVNERFSGVQRCRNKCCLTRDGNAHGVSLVQGTSGKKDKKHAFKPWHGDRGPCNWFGLKEWHR